MDQQALQDVDSGNQARLPTSSLPLSTYALVKIPLLAKEHHRILPHASSERVRSSAMPNRKVARTAYDENAKKDEEPSVSP
jgi:hypothetical protein